MKPYKSEYQRRMERLERNENIRAFMTGCVIGAMLAFVVYALILWANS